MATKRLKRPRDPLVMAKLIGDIATEQIQDSSDGPLSERGRKGGKKGGRKRAETLSAEQRSKIARRAAIARWSRSR